MDSQQLVLIKKINPQWQRNLYNGVGGKIEAGESSVDAMSREFSEETGVTISTSSWTFYARINRPGYYDLDLYFAHSDLAFTAKTVEKEQVRLFKLSDLPANIIPNLKWLIPLALDQQADFSSPISIQEIATERLEA